MLCTPSIHKNGSPYEIIETPEPFTLTSEAANEFEVHCNNICKKYRLKYLDSGNGDGSGKTPITELFKPDFKVMEGNNRHEAILRVMESLVVRNDSLLPLEEVKHLARKRNNELCKPPLDDKEFERQWKCAIKFVSKSSSSKGETENVDAREEHIEEQEDSLFAELESKIPDRDFVEYAINTAKKTVKQEDSLVRQIFYTGISAYSPDPLNLGIMAPTSEGKTYPVIGTMNLFPKDDVWYIGSMSTKTLVRQKGQLVDKNNQPLGDVVKKLKREIALLGTGKTDRIKKVELSDELSNLLGDSKNLIDLSGKTIVFLEPPDSELWNLIKPILSHDKDEREFPFVDKNSAAGIYVKNVVVRGQPACIFCSAKDESNWPQWPEIVSNS